ncbi:hypothetical protein NA57DRAFT_74946 [Rhizodiscina lignyota]|uniref:Fe2OG dioxygenase domain-containing protein n=1 Tax=Rhizodiscina lignyota TaxID=1504668 RepID=A0A9P4M9K3_9PEZI|nr:hypothetical protein NA57DRAFT_74946 [Rhizodiscina lignyota]
MASTTPRAEMSNPPPTQVASSPLQDALKGIQQAVDNAKGHAVFTCGGKIKIGTADDTLPTEDTRPSQGGVQGEAKVEHPKDKEKGNEQPIKGKEDIFTQEQTGGPIVIRYDVQDDLVTGASRKVTLPVENEADSLAALIKCCSPATFGHDGKDVYDETYRKAIKLDNTEFCTTFDPYSVGIVRIIERMLLPNVEGQKAYKRTVRAELYNLNIYSGPSGKFRPHVDTPRSSLQFGSLVVCLPSQHEGGSLAARHDGKAVIYNWWKRASNHIQWAAFYSDCEHEVLEVSSGHRITLTYNLFVEMESVIPKLLPCKLPLHETVEKLVKIKNFMTKGGTLGFYCTHAYAHTSNVPMSQWSLKGIDMAMFYVLHSLDLKPLLRPTLKENFHFYDEFEEDEEDEYDEWESDGENGEPLVPAECRYLENAIVGDELWPLRVRENRGIEGMTMDDGRDWEEHWGLSDRLKVLWLNKRPDNAQVAYAYLAYGNEPGLGARYSNATIIATVPPKRRQDVCTQ